MKRTVCLFLLLAMLISVLPVNGSAATDETKVTFFEDGSYLVETIHIVQSRASNTVSGDKTSVHYENDGTANWKLVVNGTFTYANGVAICRSSTCSVTIFDSDWYTISKSASKSGASATASATMGRKLLGVTVDQLSATVTLTCDGNGNLS